MMDWGIKIPTLKDKGPYFNYVYTERGRGYPNADTEREVA